MAGPADPAPALADGWQEPESSGREEFHTAWNLRKMTWSEEDAGAGIKSPPRKLGTEVGE